MRDYLEIPIDYEGYDDTARDVWVTLHSGKNKDQRWHVLHDTQHAIRADGLWQITYKIAERINATAYIPTDEVAYISVVEKARNDHRDV